MASLRDQIAQVQQELEHAPEHTILLTVPKLDGILVAQYRPLGYREAWRIEEKHGKVKDGAEQALLVGADKLLAACERLVRPTADPDEFEDTGYRWGVKLAREEFGLELPEGTTARQALIAIFRSLGKDDEGEELLVRHAAEYEEQRQAESSRIGARVEGESAAPPAPIS